MMNILMSLKLDTVCLTFQCPSGWLTFQTVGCLMFHEAEKTVGSFREYFLFIKLLSQPPTLTMSHLTITLRYRNTDTGSNDFN